MPTMTIPESEHVIDIVVEALDGRNYNIDEWWHYYQPVSALKGYDIFQIYTALKLRLANVFLFFAGRNDFEEKLATEIQICTLPVASLALFVEDNVIAKMAQWSKDNKTLPRDSLEYQMGVAKLRIEAKSHIDRLIEAKDKKFCSLETSESFANYCLSLGARDPLYWQKIYTRLNLEYTSTSPKGNDPVFI